MQTRKQFLTSLTPLTKLPEESDTECPICSDDFVDPVAVCRGHIFCRSCIVRWLGTAKCNTCAICRRALFTLSTECRWPPGSNRIKVLARTIEHSRLLTGDFDTYGFQGWTTCEVHKAAAQASKYLAAEDHVAISSGSKVVIDPLMLEPHIIAMANMLEGYSIANARPYSAAQCLHWKIIIEGISRLLADMNGWTVEGEGLVSMARYLKLEVCFALRTERFDTVSSRFFESDAPIESPSGDLDILLDYIVFQRIRFSRQMDEYRAAQREALESERTKLRWVL